MNRHNNMSMQMQQNRHLTGGGQQVSLPPHMQQQLPPHHHLQQPHPHHQQQQHGGPLHPHQQAPHQHQQMYAAGFQAAGPAFAAGQYHVPAAVAPTGPEGAGAAGGGAGGSGGNGGGGGGADMMVQTPYGMAPYPYAMSFQGVPYAPAQQGYPVRMRARRRLHLRFFGWEKLERNLYA